MLSQAEEEDFLAHGLQAPWCIAEITQLPEPCPQPVSFPWRIAASQLASPPLEPPLEPAPQPCTSSSPGGTPALRGHGTTLLDAAALSLPASQDSAGSRNEQNTPVLEGSPDAAKALVEELLALQSKQQVPASAAPPHMREQANPTDSGNRVLPPAIEQGSKIIEPHLNPKQHDERSTSLHLQPLECHALTHVRQQQQQQQRHLHPLMSPKTHSPLPFSSPLPGFPNVEGLVSDLQLLRAAAQPLLTRSQASQNTPTHSQQEASTPPRSPGLTVCKGGQPTALSVSNSLPRAPSASTTPPAVGRAHTLTPPHAAGKAHSPPQISSAHPATPTATSKRSSRTPLRDLSQNSHPPTPPLPTHKACSTPDLKQRPHSLQLPHKHLSTSNRAGWISDLPQPLDKQGSEMLDEHAPHTDLSSRQQQPPIPSQATDVTSLVRSLLQQQQQQQQQHLPNSSQATDASNLLHNILQQEQQQHQEPTGRFQTSEPSTLLHTLLQQEQQQQHGQQGNPDCSHAADVSTLLQSLQKQGQDKQQALPDCSEAADASALSQILKQQQQQQQQHKQQALPDCSDADVSVLLQSLQQQQQQQQQQRKQQALPDCSHAADVSTLLQSLQQQQQQQHKQQALPDCSDADVSTLLQSLQQQHQQQQRQQEQLTQTSETSTLLNSLVQHQQQQHTPLNCSQAPDASALLHSLQQHQQQQHHHQTLQGATQQQQQQLQQQQRAPELGLAPNLAHTPFSFDTPRLLLSHASFSTGNHNMFPSWPAHTSSHTPHAPPHAHQSLTPRHPANSSNIPTAQPACSPMLCSPAQPHSPARNTMPSQLHAAPSPSAYAPMLCSPTPPHRNSSQHCVPPSHAALQGAPSPTAHAPMFCSPVPRVRPAAVPGPHTPMRMPLGSASPMELSNTPIPATPSAASSPASSDAEEEEEEEEVVRSVDQGDNEQIGGVGCIARKESQCRHGQQESEREDSRHCQPRSEGGGLFLQSCSNPQQSPPQHASQHPAQHLQGSQSPQRCMSASDSQAAEPQGHPPHSCQRPASSTPHSEHGHHDNDHHMQQQQQGSPSSCALNLNPPQTQAAQLAPTALTLHPPDPLCSACTLHAHTLPHHASSLLQGAHVLIASELPLQLKSQVQQALEAAGASIHPGAHHLTAPKYTCVVSCPEHAAGWLPRCVHILSPQWVTHCLGRSHSRGSEGLHTHTRSLPPKLVCLSPDIARHLHRHATCSSSSNSGGEGFPLSPAEIQGSCDARDLSNGAGDTCSGNQATQAGAHASAPCSARPGCAAAAAAAAAESMTGARGCGWPGGAQWEALGSAAGRHALVLELKDQERKGSASTVATNVLAPLSLLDGLSWSVGQPPSEASRTCDTHPAVSSARGLEDRLENLDLCSQLEGAEEGDFRQDAFLQDEVVFRGPEITLLLPRDQLGLLGHDVLHVEPPASGLTAGALLSHIHDHYVSCLAPAEQLSLMKRHPRIRKLLQVAFLSMQPVSRLLLLGKACAWDGLTRCSSNQHVAVYVLQLM